MSRLRAGLLVSLATATFGGFVGAQTAGPPTPGASAALPSSSASGNPSAAASGIANAAPSGSTSAAPSPSGSTLPLPPLPPVLVPADAGAAAPIPDTCTERVPEGKQRPRLQQSVPRRGLAGHAVQLRVRVLHGRGETVLLGGFLQNLGQEQRDLLETAGFVLPHPDGGAGPTAVRKDLDGQSETTLTLSFVPLPKEAGRQTLILPPVPIALERASGELVVVCTQPETIEIDPPIANTPQPTLRPNPPPVPQMEIWRAARDAAVAGTVAALAALLGAWLYSWYRRRPRPEPPPPPPRPPWEIAMEELHDLRHANLIDQERYGEHFDQVCDILRKYLGDRYGVSFGDAGALESTTGEILAVLSRVVPAITALGTIEAFLREADLVKFARITPTEEQCREALTSAESIVRETVPRRTVSAEESR